MRHCSRSLIAMVVCALLVTAAGCGGNEPAGGPGKKTTTKKETGRKNAGKKGAANKGSGKKTGATGAIKPIKGSAKMGISKEPFGKVDDTAVELYTLANKNGLKVKIMTYGAIITAVEVPDRNGQVQNITLFKDTVADYKAGHPFFGATVGRYANRIAFGKFTIGGTEYTLATNNNEHHLHGGNVGFDKKIWKAEELKGDDFVGVAFRYTSPDGEEGYPGKLEAKATYTLNNDNELKMVFEATTDKPTHVNLCNHAYWNLAGAGSGDVLDQVVMINADAYLPVDDGLIPLGKPEPVADTPMDFTTPTAIGARIDQVEGGYDHCWVLNKKKPGEMSLCARVVDPGSGRVMEVSTTQPGVQFYTGNFLNGTDKGGGFEFDKHDAFCLETEHFPDSPNHPDFPTTLLKPGETYRETTIHKFSIQE